MNRVFMFALLQILDLWTTCLILTHGGKEMNPFLKFLFKLAPDIWHTMTWLFIGKLICMVLAIGMEKRAPKLLDAANVLMWIVVAWNAFNLLALVPTK